MQGQDLIREYLLEFSRVQGFTAPPLLIDYLVELLSNRVSRVDIIPDPSFAERYLQLTQLASAELYRDYADSALFFCSLMPQYGARRGLSMDYYATLGISSYYTVGDLTGDERFWQLGNWFYYLQRFLDAALHHRSLDLWSVKF